MRGLDEQLKDAQALFDLLSVPYALIGGVALAAHGVWRLMIYVPLSRDSPATLIF